MSNLYAQFRKLVPGQPLLVGKVIASTTSEVVVELPGGARITVRGAAPIGSSVFVRGGAVEGQAPAFTSAVIEV